MSYPGYTPPIPGSVPATPTAYPYGAYHPSAYAHPTTPGAYTYPPNAYQTGVTGYGWTYPYTYVPQQHPQTAAAAAALLAQHQQHQQQVQQAQQQQQQAQQQQTPQQQQQQIQAQAMQLPYQQLQQYQLARPHVTPGVATATHAHVPTAVTPLPQRTATFTAYTPSYARESMSSMHASTRGGRRQSNLKGLFTKELKNLMYGFGDDRNPANDTVNVMEEILIEYITDVCQTATAPTKKSRLSIDDLRRALSRPADAKKLARMEELLFMQEDIKRARSQFDEADGLASAKGI
ncbi:TFIID-18kDa-domain-containing protein [Agrocybe pediades]|nr:TFIID-18kDa-domain-containing protein [Agrocybe pediades]